MSIKETHNPPAFPNNDYSPDGDGQSLRDYFAAKAMQGWCAAGEVKVKPSEEVQFLNMARWSYAVADALLQARKEDPP